MTAKTSAQRQANLKARRLAAGMVKFTHWVHADDVAALRAMTGELQQRRAFRLLEATVRAIQEKK
jgi:hypothetical protein